MTDTSRSDDLVEQRYLLMKRGLYYAPDRQGYTGVKARAGRYREVDALGLDGVTAIHEDEAEDFSPACWEDTKIAVLTNRIEALTAENERLRKLTCATWFYMSDEGDRCWFSPHEVIDEMYDPEPGNHVFEVECATSLPSIWCAVRVTDDPDADERFTFTEHATEAEARAALGEK